MTTQPTQPASTPAADFPPSAPRRALNPRLILLLLGLILLISASVILTNHFAPRPRNYTPSPATTNQGNPP